MEKQKVFLEIFTELLNENGLTRKSFSEKSKIPYPTIIGWTNLGRLPDFITLGKIADFFGCSVDFLMGRQEELTPINTTLLSKNEEKFLNDYRKLTSENKNLINKLVVKLSKS